MRFYRKQSAIQNLLVRIVALIVILGAFFSMYGFDSATSGDYELWDEDWDKVATVPKCYRVPTQIGSIRRTINDNERLTEIDVEEMFPMMRLGGFWSPSSCQPQHSIGLVIAVTNPDHSQPLITLLMNIIPFLQRSRVQFRIVVVCQETQTNDTGVMKTGLLYNIGVDHLISVGTECTVLHDVNIVPLHDLNVYKCNQQYPTQLSSSLLDHPLPVGFSGAVAITNAHFRSINGFPNTVDPGMEIEQRLKSVKLKLRQTDPIIGRYWATNTTIEGYNHQNNKSSRHVEHRKSDVKFKMLKDGYNDGRYSHDLFSITREKRLLYTKIIVTLN